MKPQAKPKPPTLTGFPGVFLLSLPRTGSTLLRLILDTHPDIYCPDEIQLGHLLRALYNANEGLNECRPSVTTSGSDPEDLAESETRRVVCELLDVAMRRKGKSWWCDKSPSNLKHLDLIAKVLPEARYILLHRHCLDMTFSCLRLSTYGFSLAVVEDYVRRNHKDFLAATILAWVEQTEELLRFEQEHAGHCHAVRYEDLVAGPEEVVRGICEFLRVSFDSSFLDQVFASPRHQRSFRGDPSALYSRGIIATSVGAGAGLDPTFLRKVPGILWQRMNELLMDLGYPAAELTAEGFDMRLGPRPTDEASAPPAAAVTDIFLLIAERLRLDPSIAGRVRRSLKLALTGEGGGVWVLDLTEPPGRVLPGGAPADIVMTTSAQDFAQIFKGQLNPIVARSHGRLKLEGEVDDGALRALFFALVAGPGQIPPTAVDETPAVAL